MKTAEHTEWAVLRDRCGVYEIVASDGRRYVGGTRCLYRRLQEHSRHLRNGHHANPPLQAFYKAFGPQHLTFRPLVICAPTDLLLYEQRTINTIRPEFNVSPMAGSQIDFRHSPETKSAMSVRRSGRPAKPFSDQHRAALSSSRKHSAKAMAQLATLSAAQRGKPLSDDHREALSEALSGRVFTEAHRRRLSESQKLRWQQKGQSSTTEP